MVINPNISSNKNFSTFNIQNNVTFNATFVSKKNTFFSSKIKLGSIPFNNANKTQIQTLLNCADQVTHYKLIHMEISFLK